MFDKKTAIYMLINTVNGKKYIGKSVRPLIRFAIHKKCAMKRVNRRLYDAMNKYGVDKFELKVIDYAGFSDDPNIFERYYIRFYKTCYPEYGYNMTLGGDGGPMPLASIEKMRQKKIGSKASPETRVKMSVAHKGRKHGPMSLSQKNALSAISSKRWQDDAEFRRKCIKNNAMRGKNGSQHHMYGKKHSIATRQKMSTCAIGRPTSDHQKQVARDNWRGDKNPNFVSIDLQLFIRLLAENVSLAKMATLFPVSIPGLAYKANTMFGVKTLEEARRKARSS